MSWTDDPVRDFLQKDAQGAAEEARRPVCSCCGEPIYDSVAYRIGGKLFCESCIDDARVYLDD